MKFVFPSCSDLSEPNVEVKEFPDGDSYVRVPDAKDAEGKDVVVLNRLYPRQNTAIFQTILALRAIKEAKPKSITLIVPYLPYSRQDKVVKVGEVKSAEILCELLKSEGVDKLITFDCHFLKKEGEFNYGGLKIRNISLNKLLIEKARELAGGEELEIMSPDEGANYLVEDFGGSSMEKKRGDYIEGDVAYREIEEVKLNTDVDNKHVLILDDMISTGGTMVKAAENVKAKGAKSIICAATHGFFLNNSLEKLQEVAGEVFVSNTIQSPVSLVEIKPFIEAEFE